MIMNKSIIVGLVLLVLVLLGGYFAWTSKSKPGKGAAGSKTGTSMPMSALDSLAAGLTNGHKPGGPPPPAGNASAKNGANNGGNGNPTTTSPATTTRNVADDFVRDLPGGKHDRYYIKLGHASLVDFESQVRAAQNEWAGKELPIIGQIRFGMADVDGDSVYEFVWMLCPHSYPNGFVFPEDATEMVRRTKKWYPGKDACLIVNPKMFVD
jgi:hypothetical protein